MVVVNFPTTSAELTKNQVNSSGGGFLRMPAPFFQVENNKSVDVVKDSYFARGCANAYETFRVSEN